MSIRTTVLLIHFNKDTYLQVCIGVIEKLILI